MPGIDAVIFDIGNVLIQWQPERFYDRVIGAERRKKMFSDVDLHGMNDRVDRGESFRNVIYSTAEAYPEWQEEICMWYDRWIELAKPEIPDSVRLLRALRSRGVTVFVLSNIGEETYDMAKRVYPFLDEFDRHYLSGKLKTIKPDHSIYQMVEDDCRIAPERLLFTDDRKDNIWAASDRNWQTHLFEGPQGLERRLIDEGLLEPGDAFIK